MTVRLRAWLPSCAHRVAFFVFVFFLFVFSSLLLLLFCVSFLCGMRAGLRMCTRACGRAGLSACTHRVVCFVFCVFVCFCFLVLVLVFGFWFLVFNFLRRLTCCERVRARALCADVPDCQP